MTVLRLTHSWQGHHSICVLPSLSTCRASEAVPGERVPSMKPRTAARAVEAAASTYCTACGMDCRAFWTKSRSPAGLKMFCRPQPALHCCWIPKFMCYYSAVSCAQSLRISGGSYVPQSRSFRSLKLSLQTRTTGHLDTLSSHVLRDTPAAESQPPHEARSLA